MKKRAMLGLKLNVAQAESLFSPMGEDTDKKQEG
jgi:hypothetical protein